MKKVCVGLRVKVELWLDIFLRICYFNCIEINIHGGMAQLGARLNGIQEARGSSPLISTQNASVAEAFFICILFANCLLKIIFVFILRSGRRR